jgi:hypothetical protein
MQRTSDENPVERNQKIETGIARLFNDGQPFFN